MNARMQLDAVSLPLRGGWRLEWRRKGCLTVCKEVKGLPSGWTGVPSANGEIRVTAGARNGMLQVNETTRFGISVEAPRGEHEEAILNAPSAVFTRTSRDGTPPCGDFQAVNHLGVIPVTLLRGGLEEHLAVEVVSSKFSHETDFRQMTADIAKECQQLLLAWNMPAGLPFEKDPDRRRRLLLEQFVYIHQELCGGRLERWVESIRTRPHEDLCHETAWKSSGMVGSNHHLRDPPAYGRDWRKRTLGYTPGDLLEVRKRPSLDTPPNRFLKQALTDFAGICREVIRLLHDRKNSIGVEGPAVKDARNLLARLEGQLGSGFFREIGDSGKVPILNQTLQKREGYRDILRIRLQCGQAARLNWNGRDDVFNATVRNVAALYEYWLFFFLRRTIAALPDTREIPLDEAPQSGMMPAFCERNGLLEIRLKRGTGSLLAYEHGGANGLRIHFCFDRTYSPKKDVLAGGAYTKAFRPDFSLVIFPAEFAHGHQWDKAERVAEAAGRIAYLHFDAKYRVDNLGEIFPQDSEALLEEEESSKATNTYKRADLYKMHTYNDAIRRTVGSYILYPGKSSSEVPYSKYHELLPGLGAFAVSPSATSASGREIGGFLSKVFAAQRDRFSQLARINYWIHDTIREEPGEYHFGDPSDTGKPPKDVTLVLGFVRSSQDAETFRKTSAFYWHAIEWNDPALPTDERMPGQATQLGFDPMRADYLGIYRRGITEPWIARVIDVKIVSAVVRASELEEPLESMKAAYYYRLQLSDFVQHPSRDIKRLVGKRPGKPIVCSIADFASCEPVA